MKLKSIKLNLFFTVLIFNLFILTPVIVHADCITDQYGKVICGEGQCVKDIYSKVFCANAGGGAIRNYDGKVMCGIGKCDTNLYGKVKCSKKPGGGALKDNYGKVVCLEGCVDGSSDYCQ